MSDVRTKPLTERDYERMANEYLASLPLEHFMEATPHAAQRRITIESLDLLRVRRGDFQFFNELLVQYPFEDDVGQVVPDNMVVLGAEPARAQGSYALEYEKRHPLVVFEYVSRSTTRKDYHDNRLRYERELAVPYYVIFDPETQELQVHRLADTKYELTTPDMDGRFPIPELELQLGVHDGWMRFWHRRELLPLTAELDAELERRDRELQQRDHALKQRDNELSKSKERIGQLESEADAYATEKAKTLALLKGEVERRARDAGRADILELLHETTDTAVLVEWLGELD